MRAAGSRGLAAVGCMVMLLAGCASSVRAAQPPGTTPSTGAHTPAPAPRSAVGHVSSFQAAGPTIFVSGEARCPPTLGRARDVANDPAPTKSLLPAGAEPRAALVCRYASPSPDVQGRSSAPGAGPTIASRAPSSPGPSTAVDGDHSPRLTSSVPLNAKQAAALATAINHISLAPAKGTFSCGAAAMSRTSVLAFSYAEPSRTVDLWYDPTGCGTLDNGDVLAFEGANASFYTGFVDAFDAAAHIGK